jgi:hypothetical protein
MLHPYGVWVTADGAEILFDRGYRPRWHRRPGEAATPMLGNEWIKWNEQNYFFCGVIDMPLFKKLQKVEADFVAGLEIQLPIRPLDECLGRARAERVVARQVTREGTKSFPRLVWSSKRDDPKR